ncbi:hypothetical protein EVAR_94345_1 [Eumeta japonica]|uniref:Uncharacterized protein n=1 Tax=Eumeta variegata TaxID=151549 RepID=A0A4C1TPU6_EUMVA|nr:hypothetical protein EVAR_94345_1 [Eumeta japonica]
MCVISEFREQYTLSHIEHLYSSCRSACLSAMCLFSDAFEHNTFPHRVHVNNFLPENRWKQKTGGRPLAPSSNGENGYRSPRAIVPTGPTFTGTTLLPAYAPPRRRNGTIRIVVSTNETRVSRKKCN